jgi:ribosome recycling factor
MTVAQTTKYVIKYKLNGERRFEFAQLVNGTEEEAKVALAAIHGQGDDVISEISVSKAL